MPHTDATLAAVFAAVPYARTIRSGALLPSLHTFASASASSLGSSIVPSIAPAITSHRNQTRTSASRLRRPLTPALHILDRTAAKAASSLVVTLPRPTTYQRRGRRPHSCAPSFSPSSQLLTHVGPAPHAFEIAAVTACSVLIAVGAAWTALRRCAFIPFSRPPTWVLYPAHRTASARRSNAPRSAPSHTGRPNLTPNPISPPRFALLLIRRTRWPLHQRRLPSRSITKCPRTWGSRASLRCAFAATYPPFFSAAVARTDVHRITVSGVVPHGRHRAQDPQRRPAARVCAAASQLSSSRAPSIALSTTISTSRAVCIPCEMCLCLRPLSGGRRALDVKRP